MAILLFPGAFGPVSPGLAQTADPYLFATCAGRFSALMEHQWLLSDPASDTTARERAAMLSLVEASLPPEDQTAALIWRVEAKAAQAALLSHARFGPSAQARQAQRRSQELLAQCRALLLG